MKQFKIYLVIFCILLTSIIFKTDVKAYENGITIEKSSIPGRYDVTFQFENKTAKSVKSVTLYGSLQWYEMNDPNIVNYKNDTVSNGMQRYDAYSIKNISDLSPYFVTDGKIGNSNYVNYGLNPIGNNKYSITLNLPANFYDFKYYVKYNDGSEQYIFVENNDFINPISKHQPARSLVFIGDSNEAPIQNQLAYPRKDNLIGSFDVFRINYGGTDIDLGVRLPYQYDKNKTYKTLYYQHGLGGNETTGFGDYAIGNIIDNLIADYNLDECIVVTINGVGLTRENLGVEPNNYLAYSKLYADALENAIIPAVENRYSVSHNQADRAMSGFSAGGIITSYLMLTNPFLFDYWGITGYAADLVELFELSENEITELKKDTIFLAAGNCDYGNEIVESFAKKLTNINIPFHREVNLGDHGAHSASAGFSTFAKDYLWKKSTINPPVDNREQYLLDINVSKDANIVSIVGNIQDNDILEKKEVIEQGIIYAKNKNVIDELTIHTYPSTKISFKKPNENGEFSYSYKKSSSDVEYVTRAYIIYKNDQNKTIVKYSTPKVFSVNGLN